MTSSPSWGAAVRGAARAARLAPWRAARWDCPGCTESSAGSKFKKRNVPRLELLNWLRCDARRRAAGRRRDRRWGAIMRRRCCPRRYPGRTSRRQILFPLLLPPLQHAASARTASQRSQLGRRQLIRKKKLPSSTFEHVRLITQSLTPQRARD